MQRPITKPAAAEDDSVETSKQKDVPKASLRKNTPKAPVVQIPLPQIQTRQSKRLSSQPDPQPVPQRSGDTLGQTNQDTTRLDRDSKQPAQTHPKRKRGASEDSPPPPPKKMTQSEAEDDEEAKLRDESNNKMVTHSMEENRVYMQKMASKTHEWEAMYKFLDNENYFAQWMEWILQYLPGRAYWRHQLVELTLENVEDEFSVKKVEKLLIARITKNISVPSMGAFSAVIGISYVVTASLSETLQIKPKKGALLHIALLILSARGAWKVMLIRTASESIMHLDSSAEQFRGQIQEIITDLVEVSVVLEFNVIPLVSWVQPDSEELQQHRRDLMQNQAKTVHQQAPSHAAASH